MNCFHHESRVSNQIVTLLLPREMQTFSACGSLSFTIQNIYVNSNPVFKIFTLIQTFSISKKGKPDIETKLEEAGWKYT